MSQALIYLAKLANSSVSATDLFLVVHQVQQTSSEICNARQKLTQLAHSPSCLLQGNSTVSICPPPRFPNVRLLPVHFKKDVLSHPLKALQCT